MDKSDLFWDVASIDYPILDADAHVNEPPAPPPNEPEEPKTSVERPSRDTIVDFEPDTDTE